MTLRIFIAKFETLVDINVIKLCILCKLNTKKWSTCVSLLSTCACKIWLKKVSLVIEILAKQHRGHFLRDTLYIWGIPCQRARFSG